MNLHPSRLLEINFPDVLLPDSATDEINSNGFIKYKIKAMTNLQTEELILNKASIYFDYNQPVTTNTVELQVVDMTGFNESLTTTPGIIVYPNPGNGIIHIKLNNSDSKIYSTIVSDITGKQLMKIYPTPANSIILTMESLNSGTYFLKVIGINGEIYFAKFIMIKEGN
jgi:hypothetical protein